MSSYVTRPEAFEYFKQIQQELMQEEKRRYAIIAASDLNGGIAKDNKIPWHYPEDFAWFKHATSDGVCVMGKNTYNEILQLGGGECLPGRECIVISSTQQADDSTPTNVTFHDNIETISSIIKEDDRHKIVWFVGGVNIYKYALGIADVVYMTHINIDAGCDTFFPTDAMSRVFELAGTQPTTNKDLAFAAYRRKQLPTNINKK